MIYRDQHTQLSITTPVLDPSAFTTLAEDLSPAATLEYLTTFTSLLDARITRIEQTLTRHHTPQNTQDIEDAWGSNDSDETVEALLSLRTGAVMAGAPRLQLITTRALTEVREGSIAVQPLIVQLRQEAQWFTAAIVRLYRLHRLHSPSAQFAA